ncbi:MAG: peroxidase [Acidobacteriota bacterium]
MAWIKIIPPTEAVGKLKKEYDEAINRAGYVANILQIQSLNSEALNRCIELYKTVMFGASGLSQAEREMLATVVSSTNGCFY